MNTLFKLYYIIILVKCSFELIPHCVKYTNRTEKECEKCEDDFTLLSGQCPCYDRNCKICSSSLLGGCIKCKKNFILDESSGACLLYIPHCLYFTEYGCTKCLEGYKLVDGYKCEKINMVCNDKNCLRCIINSNSQEECVECKSKYYLIGGSCFYNTICYKSNLDNDYNSYDMCLPFCFYNGKECIQKCDILYNTLDYDDKDDDRDEDRDDDNCIKCNKKGFAVEKLNCHIDNDKLEHCAMSDPNNLNICKRCEIGYRLQILNCVICEIENCLICESYKNFTAKCVSCLDGYELVNGKCYSINDYFAPLYRPCTKVSKNENFCFECQSNYSRINGKCILCNISNCAFCFEENKCAQCKPNYIYNSQSDECNFIGPNSKNKECIYSDNNVYCFPNSDITYFQNENNILSLTYYSLTSKCLTSECAQCHGDTCKSLQCDLRTYYNSSLRKCKECPENCDHCLDRFHCSECKVNYGLYNGQCIKINNSLDVEDCIEYDYFGHCLKCASKCALRSNGTCSCKERTIILILVVVCVFLILIGLVICFILYRWRMMRNIRVMEMEREQNERRRIELIESKKIPDEKIGQISDKDKILAKCDKCKKELAYYQIYPCLCKLCDVDFGEIDTNDENQNKMNEVINTENKEQESPVRTVENNEVHNTEKDVICNTNNNKELDNQSIYSKVTNVDKYVNKKCNNCNKDIVTVKKIAKKCEICFSITSELFHFPCECALKVCGECYNKILKKDKLCPQCRKEILSENDINNNNNENEEDINENE